MLMLARSPPSGLFWTFAGIAAVGVVLFLFSLTDSWDARASGWRPYPPPAPHELRPAPPPAPDPRAVWAERAERVKRAFVRAYVTYEETAQPYDEILPLSGGKVNNFNGWGVSMVDSLDTMLLMGLDDIFNRSIPHVARLTFDEDDYVPFFETVIRYVGGLLSAHALSGNKILLSRADDLARRLLPAFDTGVGLPAFSINPHNGATRDGWQGASAILSELGSCQMEFRYLAHLTGRREYIWAVDRVTEHLRVLNETDGLFSSMYTMRQGIPSGSSYSAGAMADSAYEYLLKEWLLTGRKEQKFLDMYLKSADGILTNLLYLSPKRHLLYATDLSTGSLRPSGQHEHLVCFLAGLFALGAATVPPAHMDARTRARHRWAAAGLAHTCWITYADSATGLGPESVVFPNSNWDDDEDEVEYGVGGRQGTPWVHALEEWEERRDAARAGGVEWDEENWPPPGVRDAKPVKRGEDTEYVIRDARYMLRPETIESFYLLWRTTGDSKWRERGWAAFDAIERYARVGRAYATIADVDEAPPPHVDEMPSFFLAETLKYAYLLFLDAEPVPLDTWVFNTEAHPLPVFEWAEWEVHAFNVSFSGAGAGSGYGSGYGFGYGQGHDHDHHDHGSGSDFGSDYGAGGAVDA